MASAKKKASAKKSATKMRASDERGQLVVRHHATGELAEIGVQIAGAWHGLRLTLGSETNRGELQQAQRRYEHGALLGEAFFDWHGRPCTSSGEAIETRFPSHVEQP